MPRVKPLIEDTRSKFIGAVAEGKAREGIGSNAELAEMVGMPPSTLSKYMRDPDLFHRGELRKLFMVLHIPKEEWGRLL